MLLFAVKNAVDLSFCFIPACVTEKQWKELYVNLRYQSMAYVVTQKEEEEEEEENSYFSSYSHYGIHEEMLKVQFTTYMYM